MIDDSDDEEEEEVKKLLRENQVEKVTFEEDIKAKDTFWIRLHLSNGFEVEVWTGHGVVIVHPQVN